MLTLSMAINNYLDFCWYQKRVSSKTIKAYRTDLLQFADVYLSLSPASITTCILEEYIQKLHKEYMPKTVKRKIASLRAFFHYLEYRDIVETNPFHKLQTRFREPVILPKTIPLSIIEQFLSNLYRKKEQIVSGYAQKKIVRDIAIVELLFSTGVRISELCSLRPPNINLFDNVILIYGKGSKERRIQLGNEAVILALKEYKEAYKALISPDGYFFVNRFGSRLSEQSVRVMINHYTQAASIDLHITPHMFRHTFATCLLEADVDIRFIQELLGHSSITITEVYTHVAVAKQKSILSTRHPRMKLLKDVDLV